MALTDSRIRNTKSKAQAYKLSDGGDRGSLMTTCPASKPARQGQDDGHSQRIEHVCFVP